MTAKRPGVILSLGELLVELMRPEADAGLTASGTFLGPYASGAPAIFAWAAARMGTPSRFAGVCGADPFGAHCTAHLGEAGVSLHVRHDPEHETGMAFVAYQENGERDFLFHLRHAAAAQLKPSDVTPEILEDVAWLHITGSSLGVSESMQEAVYHAVAAGKGQGTIISFDPNVRSDLLGGQTLETLCAPVLDAADIVLPSSTEAALLTGISDLDEACRSLQRRGKTVLLKQGAKGSTLFADGLERHVPSIRVQEIDPTGAGDCFAAGFAVASLEGQPLEDAVRFANVVGALSTTAFGPTSAPLSYAAVMAHL